jgi:NAD(P)-dependent dehydrogenase (short-subunit alcohol dehydrogenase family)
MPWSPDRHALRGRGEVVTGSTRGAGRGIAAALSEAGATVVFARGTAPADFALSETPRYVGRAVVALASDPDRARWNQQSVSSAQIAPAYGFTELDGSQPDIRRYFAATRETGGHADLGDYR